MKLQKEDIRKVLYEYGCGYMLDNDMELFNEVGEIYHKKKLQKSQSDNCPNLTNLWNEAVEKQNRGEHNIYITNDCWGALRTLEKHGLCKINDY